MFVFVGFNDALLCSCSAVRNWTCIEVAEWMMVVVELPELAEVVRRHDITGQYLPA